MRQDLIDEGLSCRGQFNPIGPTVAWNWLALDESALFQTIHQAGDVGPIHDKGAAEFRLRHALRGGAQKIENVELAYTEFPTIKQNPARIPKDIGSAQELKSGLIARTRTVSCIVHINRIYLNSSHVNKTR